MRACVHCCARVYVRNWAKRQRGPWEPPSHPVAAGGDCLCIVLCQPLESSPEELKSLALCPGDLKVAEGTGEALQPRGLPSPPSTHQTLGPQPASKSLQLDDVWLFTCWVCSSQVWGEGNEQGLGVTTAVKDPVGMRSVGDGLPCLAVPSFPPRGDPSRPRIPSASARRCRPVPCFGRQAR